MWIYKLLTPLGTCCNLEAGSKKMALEQAAKLVEAQYPELDASVVFNGLHAREKLGSTGMGEGVAIPHCRLAECKAASGYILKLSTPIDFDAIDGQAVDLLFVLVVPEEETTEHLETLAAIASIFRQAEARDELRNTSNATELFQAITRLSVE